MTQDGGRFITFEGGDGAGKTTQLRRLAARLRAEGRDVVETREPGGAPGAEEIRRLVLEGEPGRWSPVTELLLFNAARRDHVERTIRPALDRGAVVLCDRFADSTRVYQGVARGAGAELADRLHELAIGLEPDLTLILEIPPETGLARGLARGIAEERFEKMGVALQETVRNEFRRLAAAHPDRCRLIDASGTEDEVAARVAAAVAPLLEPAP